MQQGSVGCYESQVPVNLEKKIRVKDSTELKDNQQDEVINVKTVEKGAAGGEDRDNLVVGKTIVDSVQPVRNNNQNNLGIGVTTENNDPEVKVKMEIQETPDGLAGDQTHNHHHHHHQHNHHHRHHHHSVKKETVIKEGCSEAKAESTTNKPDQLSPPSSSSAVSIGHRNAPTNVNHHNEPSIPSSQKPVGSDFLKPSSQYHPQHPPGYHHPGAFPGMGGGKMGTFNFQNFYAASTPFQIHGQHNSPGIQHHPANKVSGGGVHHGHVQNTHRHQHPVTNSATNSGSFRGRPPLQSNNENYLHHRFNNNFHHLATPKLPQHQPTGSSYASSVPPTPTGATVSNYSGYQTTVSSNSSSLQLTAQQNCNAAPATIQAYNNHQNNNYRTHYPRHRKWNNPTGLRGLHPPPMPWPTWFFRPEIPPISSASVTTNVSNSLNGPISSSLTPRIHPEVTKAQDTPKDGSKVHGQTPTICTSIRCTVNGCSCDSFTPGKRHLRYCDKCHHGWVPHALARLSSSNGVAGSGTGVGGDVASNPLPCGRDENGAVGRVGRIGGGEERSAEQEVEKSRSPESVEPTAAFDVASLVLYGSRALPIRLKILLDQLFNQLPHPQVTRLLAAFGWTNEDYSRGYILQDSQNGPVLDRWSICSAEEEPLVLQQFLRFAETRPFVQQLLLAAGTPGSDAMSPSRRPSPPTMPLAHLPPPLHLLHCGLPPPGSRLPHPPVPPVSHPSMSPSSAQKHVYNPITGSSNAPTTPTTIGGNNSPPRTTIENSHLTVSPLNRLQSMQPFDFRKLGALGLPGFPPLPPPPPADILLGSRKSMRHSQSCYSPPHHLSNSQLRPPVPTMPPVSSAALNFSHSLAAAVSSGTLPPNFPNHFPPPPIIGKPNSGGMQTTTNPVDMHSSGEKSSDFGSEDDEDDDENSGSALNLSRRDSMKHDHHHNHHHHNHNHHHHHHQMSMQPAPLGRPPGVPGRKPHSPGKRQQWGTSPNLPLNLGTQFINPATGKKRVQCNVCLKTFCDKGALKIHFSAVHLREMHKCTVEGCNMMFSSRRSRNRHSANPNPKLHSPHLRRKISPHDGRSSMAHALVLPPQVGLPVPATGLNPLSFGSFPLLTPPPDLRHSTSLAALDFKHLDLSSTQNNRGYEEFQQRRTSSNTTASMSPPAPPTIPEGEEDDDDDDGIVVVAEDENQLQPQREDHEDREDQPADFSLAKRARMSVSDLDDDLASNGDSNEEDSMSTTDQQSSSVRKNSLNSNLIHLGRGVRKRKSQNPTRCAMPAEIHSSSTDGDSSNDAIFQDQPEDMSMSRLQEVEEGKTESPSPKNLVSSRESRSNSGSPETSCTGEREPETEPIDAVPVNSSSSNNGAAGTPAGVLKVEEEPLQEEPRDLSSRASSGRRSPAIRQRTVTPEPKTVSPSTPPPEISSPGPGHGDTSLKEEKRDDPDDDDRDELEDDDDEDERPMQEGSNAVRNAGGFEVWPNLYQPNLYPNDGPYRAALEPAGPIGPNGANGPNGHLLSWLTLIQRLALHNGHGHGQ
ncbi:uncharacterized protein LOC105686793 isoform X2 [Athalia rosae]|uniref:uncharacterized protein LOC105686793 isoform X2 n=1 Tax=Athalia rosae TaxID=37344 RepID=UPI002033F701|nr:uncharacterized protein LOC105686793 isoform X2 [Athalia rosae]